MNLLREELATWTARLDTVLGGNCQHLRGYHLVAETPSTQDTARQIDAQPGTVVIAGRQTAGRGRYGRSWTDCGHDGVAMSLVLPWENPQQLAIACAVGVASGLRTLRPATFQLGIKWPNDVLARPNDSVNHGDADADLFESGWRKLAGILIEQHGDNAIVGIGINVGQSRWPDDLKDRAISLAQLTRTFSRTDVMAAVLPAIDVGLQIDDSAVRSVFGEYDILTGRTTRLWCAGKGYSGAVSRIDPFEGLELQPEQGGDPIWCPAESTTLAC